MKESALEHLVCLQCLSPLVLVPGYSSDPEHSAEIYTGSLKCTSCSAVFSIVRGVPRMVDEQASHPVDIRTGRSFAEAWKRFPFMDDRYQKQFFDWVFPVDNNFLKGKLVLECGCGKGRHAKLINDAKAIFAVDIGEAIDVAYSNVGHLANVHLVQADIERLPFKNDFDFAFSVGVLHHMRSPISGFLAMSEKVNPGGSITAWVYGRENNWWLIKIINPIRETITSKLPSPVLLCLSAMIAFPLLVYCNVVASPYCKRRAKTRILPPLYYGPDLS